MLLSKCRCNRHLDFTKKLKIFCLQWTLDQKFSIFVIVFFQNKIFLFESEAFDAKRKAWCITHSKIQTLLILTVKPINIAQICKQTEYPKSTFSIALLAVNMSSTFKNPYNQKYSCSFWLQQKLKESQCAPVRWKFV